MVCISVCVYACMFLVSVCLHMHVRDHIYSEKLRTTSVTFFHFYSQTKLFNGRGLNRAQDEEIIPFTLTTATFCPQNSSAKQQQLIHKHFIYTLSQSFLTLFSHPVHLYIQSFVHLYIQSFIYQQ